MIYGYAFWYILSRITTPDVIGISSSLISLAVIFISVASIGIPIGSQRFLGKMFLERKFEDISVFIRTSLLITTIGIFSCCVLMLMAKDWLFDTYPFNLFAITFILIASSAISVLFRYVIIASLETRKLLVISIVSSGVKLLLTIILVFRTGDELAVIIGFTIAPILTAILFAINVKSLIKKVQIKSSFKFLETFKILLRASVAAWIPSLIDTIGGQIGTVTVLAIQGSSQAGFYFIAFQISIGISAVIWALESVTYPVLSAMSAGRNLFLWRVIKIGLIIVVPLSSSAIFYSTDIMQIFGYNYAEGSLPLQLLLMSILPIAVSAGISILMYSYGSYRDVLIIGLATSVPRIILYFILIPWYSISGAALSFTIGSILGFIVSIIISKRHGKIIFWKELSLIFFIPILFGFLLSILNIHFIPSILVSVILSYLLLLKLNILNKNDVTDSFAVLPSNLGTPVSEIINKIGSKLNRKY